MPSKQTSKTLEKSDSDFLFRPRLYEYSPNIVVSGTELHTDYKSASDDILISHLSIGTARDPMQFTTSFFHFAFSHSLGHTRILLGL